MSDFLPSAQPLEAFLPDFLGDRHPTAMNTLAHMAFCHQQNYHASSNSNHSAVARECRQSCVFGMNRVP